MLENNNKLMRAILIIYFYTTIVGSILLLTYRRQYFWAVMAWVLFFVVMYIFFKLQGLEESAKFRKFIKKNNSKKPIVMYCGWKYANMGFFEKAVLSLENGSTFSFESEGACKRAVRKCMRLNRDFRVQHNCSFYKNGQPVRPSKAPDIGRFWKETLP